MRLNRKTVKDLSVKDARRLLTSSEYANRKINPEMLKRVLSSTDVSIRSESAEQIQKQMNKITKLSKR